MKVLILKIKKMNVHFRVAARNKVRELGLDGAVMYYLEQYRYYKNNPMYEMSWLYVSIYGMILEYLVNDIS